MIIKDLTYNLEYWIGNKHVETVLYNIPKSIAKWKEKQLKKTTHTMGVFKYVENKIIK
jgi:hypothetical protein